jgi:hypothetical protein
MVAGSKSSRITPFDGDAFFALENKRGACTLQGIIETTLAWHDVILEAGERLLRLAGFDPDSLVGNDFR